MTSTSLKSDHGVNDPHDVSSGKMDDLAQRHVTNVGGALADCAAHTSAGNNVSDEKLTSPPNDSGKIDVRIAITHDEAFREWMRLDKEQAAIGEES